MPSGESNLTNILYFCVQTCAAIWRVKLYTLIIFMTQLVLLSGWPIN